MDSIVLGDVEVVRIVEWHGRILTPATLVPDSPEELWRANESWLAPEFWDPAEDACVGAVQTWVLRSEGRTVLVDTGVGNDRDRPQIPVFDHLRTDFLDRLALAGVAPEDVDVVVNTHVHYDHVGWNTFANDGGWAPTFPNATYLIPRADNEFFDPRNAHRRPPPRDEQERLRRVGGEIVFEDSIAPIHREGRAVLWEGSYRIDRNLSLEAAPGHTPGSSVLRLSSGTDRAVFVGDLLHSPVQILHPEHNSCFCEDPVEAAETRHRVLARAADLRELVVPAHFGGHGAAEVRRDGSRFRIGEWAAFSPAA